MKKSFWVASVANLVLLFAQTSYADLIAYWNFNTLSIATASAPGSGGVPTSLAASQGTGTMSLTGYGGLVDDFGGTTINVIGGDPAEESLSLVAGNGFPGNGTFVDFNISTTGLENLTLTYAQQRTATGFNSNAWSFSTDGGSNFTPVTTLDLGAPATTFATVGTVLIDMTSFAVNDKASLIVRLTVNGASNSSGNNRFDNIQFNATPIVPEPAGILLGGIGLIGVVGLARARRNRA